MAHSQAGYVSKHLCSQLFFPFSSIILNTADGPDSIRAIPCFLGPFRNALVHVPLIGVGIRRGPESATCGWSVTRLIDDLEFVRNYLHHPRFISPLFVKIDQHGDMELLQLPWTPAQILAATHSSCRWETGDRRHGMDWLLLIPPS